MGVLHKKKKAAARAAHVGTAAAAAAHHRKAMLPNGLAARVLSVLAVEPRLLSPVQNVQNTGTAFLDLSIGVTYRNIRLYLTGTLTLAMITAIRVIANGQTIHNITGTQRDILNQFEKMTAYATNRVLTIPFVRMGMKGPNTGFYSGLCTGKASPQCPIQDGIRTLRLEIDIAGATGPGIIAFADVCDADPAQALQLWRTEVWSEQVSAGAQEYTHTHKYQGDANRATFNRFTFVAADTEVTGFRMLVNKQEVVNRNSKVNEQAQTDQNVRAPQSGYVIYDTSEDGCSHPIKLGNVADFELHTTHAAGGINMSVIAESLGVLNA